MMLGDTTVRKSRCTVRACCGARCIECSGERLRISAPAAFAIAHFAALLFSLIACSCFLPAAYAEQIETKIGGVDSKLSAPYTKNLDDSITIEPAYGREVELYAYDTKRKSFELVRTFKTANKKKAKLSIRYPGNWKTRETSTWKIVVPKSKDERDLGNAPEGESAKARVFSKATAKVTIRCERFLDCKAGIVMDAQSGKVVYSYQPFKKRKIASLTKMMTALLLVERKKPSATIRMSASAASTPFGYGFSSGQRFSLRNALYAMMLPSSNEMASAVAQSISGSNARFAKLMTKRAKKLGCKKTVYKNPHGLDRSGAYSCAFDQALIARYIMTSPDTSLIRKAVRTKRATVYTTSGASYRLKNTNKMLKTKWNAIGLKTGTEDDALKCFAGAFKIGSRTYVTVVLGARSDSKRYSNTKKLVKFAKYAAKHKLPEYEL